MTDRSRRSTLTGFAILLFASILQSSEVRAFESVPIDLHEAYRDADAVVVARVRSGVAPEGSCGASYEAAVTSVLKGKLKPGSSISVSGGVGYKLGVSYVMLLTKDDPRERRREAGTLKDNCRQASESDFYQGYTTGPFEVTRELESGYVILFPEMKVTVPPEIYKQIHEDHSGRIWAVDVERVKEYLINWAKGD